MAKLGEGIGWNELALAATLGGVLLLIGCGGSRAGEAAGSGGEEGDTAAASADAERGHELYIRTCAMCHGVNGEGVQRLGKNLRDNAFVRERSDEELVRFLIEGRGPDHPDNTQGIAMPPRGGNRSLTDEDLAQIVAYMRTLS